MRRVHLLAAAVTVAVASVAVAQQAAQRHILHEDLPGPSDKPSPLIGETGSGGNPTAIVAGDKVLPPPPLEAKPDPKSEPVLGKGGFAADRETQMKPDENTGADQTLHYVSVFNPDVLPFKRMSAFDAVAEDYTLHVDRNVLTTLAVGGTTDKMRDRFWGSVAVELAPSTDVPLPSVAPDMRILSYEIKPKVALRFEKDGADNFYVRTDDPRAGGTYRLVFLADADAGYFAPSLPAQRMTARQVAEMAPPELKPALPPRVVKAARRTIERLAIDPDEALQTSFNRLVGYFRAFTAKPAPARSDDVYRDLCDSQAGVCRHRSFAFMITANALGIPTRFVSNEAHAFVEVWFPQRGWQRIDLGGAALKMEVTGANDKTLHRPRADDPFEKPPEYKNNYTQLEGEISGLTDQQLADKKRPLDSATASGSFAGPGGPGGRGSGAGGDTGDEITPDPTLPALATDPKKPTPHLAVTTADTAAYRGDVVHVEGQASVAGKGLPDHRIDVFLSPVGQHGRSAVKIGTAFTAADGTFKVDLEVPKTMALSTYELYLSSPEDAYFNGALTTE